MCAQPCVAVPTLQCEGGLPKKYIYMVPMGYRTKGSLDCNRHQAREFPDAEQAINLYRADAHKLFRQRSQLPHSGQ